MQMQLFRLVPSLFVLAAACSDGGEATGLPPVGGSSSVAGSSGQASGGGTAGSPGAGGGGGIGSGGAGSSMTGGVASSGGSGGTPTSGGTGGVVFGGTGGTATGGGGGGGGAPPLDGKGLYDLNCKACHGEQGTGSKLAPEIKHPVRDYSTWVVRNGRAMTTFPKAMEKWDPAMLSDAQLMLIFDYLDLPPQPTTGQALYDDYCTNCHGTDGKGGPTMRDITNEVGKVLTQVRSGKNVGKFAMRRDYMPAFPASDISDPELMLIRDYVNSL